jgi:fumarate hydratase, class I
MDEKIKTLGTAACPPYHLAIVIGGLSAELTLKTVKLASTKYLDHLPTTCVHSVMCCRIGKLTRPEPSSPYLHTHIYIYIYIKAYIHPRALTTIIILIPPIHSGNEHGRAFRDVEWEAKIHELTQRMGIGAQFGGKYFCHDVRVIRLPRHGASCPVGIGVSCSADRQAKGKVTRDGVFLEQLETDVGKYLPEVDESALATEKDVIQVDLNRPMAEVRAALSQYPIKTRLSLSGTLVVARDIAHAKLLERIEQGKGLPEYVKDHIIYYAGPAKTPQGYASGSFGPTTAGRMDSYVDTFMEHGGSFVTLAKGNRSKVVTKACKKHGGFYLGSIGGPAAILAQNNIKKVEVLEYPELGMEAIWKIEVENFPAFIVVDDKGNDFFQKWSV